MAHTAIAALSSVLIWLSAILVAVSVTGCGTGGKEDDTESTSSASTEVTQCGDVSVTIPAEELEQVVEDALAETPDAEIIVDEVNSGGLDQQTRLLKVTIVAGCGNTVVNEDNDSVSDDDVSTTLNTGASEE